LTLEKKKNLENLRVSSGPLTAIRSVHESLSCWLNASMYDCAISWLLRSFVAIILVGLLSSRNLWSIIDDKHRSSS
jgi:hypothetical protein